VRADSKVDIPAEPAEAGGDSITKYAGYIERQQKKFCVLRQHEQDNCT